MRNASVVLVFLLTGFVSGFIVPSSAPEFLVEDAILNDEYATKQEETKISTISEFDVLPTDFDQTNVNNLNLQNTAGIDEKVLYEYATEKATNVNERSFLYINQRFKTPLSSQLYNSQFQDLNLPMKSIQKPSKTGVGLPLFMEYPNRFATRFFQPSIDEYINPNIVQTEYNHKCNDNKKSMDVYASEDKHTFKTRPQTSNKGTEDQRSYLELLKPPLLRPLLNHNDNKFNFDDKGYKNLPSAEFSVHNLMPDQRYPKLQTLSAIAENPSKTVNELSRLYSIQKPVFIGNHLNYGLDDLSFKNKHIDGGETQRTVNNKKDEDRQLDRYLKDTYEEQITNERMTVGYNDCNYRNCVIGASKQQSAIQPYVNNKPDCNCRIKLNLRAKKPNIQRDRLEREETVYRTTPVPKSSEINGYEDILHEENSDNLLNDELLKTVDKLNDTLQMYQ